MKILRDNEVTPEDAVNKLANLEPLGDAELTVLQRHVDYLETFAQSEEYHHEHHDEKETDEEEPKREEPERP